MRMNGGDEQAGGSFQTSHQKIRSNSLDSLLSDHPGQKLKISRLEQEGSLPSPTDDGFPGTAVPTARVKVLRWQMKVYVDGERLDARRL